MSFEEIAILIFVVIAIIAIVIGLIKKTLWLCIVGAIIAALFFILQPENLKTAATQITAVFDGSVDPLKRDDDFDVILEENSAANDRFDDLGLN